MKACPGLAVMGTMLVLASPAAAQGPSVEGGDTNQAGPNPPATRQVPPDSQSVAVDPRALAAIGPSGPRLFGSVDLADNAHFGVGLFSVVGSTEKEQLRRRMDPTRAFLPAATRVAAVGFSMRF
jgi:hypothetical protein